MYNMSPFKKEPDPKDDPAYMWGFNKGEVLLDFLLGVAILPFLFGEHGTYVCLLCLDYPLSDM